MYIPRRRFLESCGWFAAGAVSTSLIPISVRAFAIGGLDESTGAEQRVRELKLKLPPPSKPVATYQPAVRAGDILYVSGYGPRRPDGTFIRGKVGQDLTLKQGKEAARLVGINVLGTVRGTLGSLDKVVQLVKVLGMVNCTPDFGQQPEVINGFSDLMADVFGKPAGVGARSAVGMGSLPFNIPVEIEAIFQVK